MSENEEVLAESLREVEEARASRPSRRPTSKRYTVRVRSLGFTGTLFRRHVVKARFHTTEGTKTAIVPKSVFEGQYATFRVVSMSGTYVVCSIPNGNAATLACFPRKSVTVREV